MSRIEVILIPKGTKASGAIPTDHVKNLDWKIRNAELICKLPDETTNEVLKRLNTLLS